FHAPSTSEFYSLSLHDALPILGFNSEYGLVGLGANYFLTPVWTLRGTIGAGDIGSLYTLGTRFYFDTGSDKCFFIIPCDAKIFVDRKSTRLNSSHVKISYAVFC